MSDSKQAVITELGAGGILRSVIDNANDALFIHDIRTGMPVGVNRTAADLFGYPEQEMNSMHFLQISAGAAPETKREALRRLQKTRSGEVQVFEWMGRHADGHPFPVEVRLCSNEMNGCLLSIAWVREVMTTRKEAEAALQESEGKYRAFYEHAPLAYQSLNEAGCLKDINSAWLRILGYERDEVIGRCFSDFLHPDFKPKFEKSFPTFKARGNVTGVEFLMRHKEGHYLNVQFDGGIGYNPDGSFRQTYCVFQDITARIAADAELKSSREQFSTLLSNLPGMAYVCEYDEDWTMHFISDGCVEITGYKPEDLVSNKVLSLNQLIHPDDRKMVADRIRKSLDAKRHFEIEYRIITRSGKKKWVWERGICRADRNEQTVIEGFISDITKRRETKQRMADLARFPKEDTNPVIRISDEGVLLYANPASKKMMPSPEGRIGRPVSGKWKSLMRQALRAGQPSEWELQLSGRVFAATFVPIPERSYVNLYANDITERKRARDALRKSEEHLRTMLDSIGDAVISTDVNGLVTDMNPVAQRLTGYNMDEVCRTHIRSVFNIINEETREPLPNPVDQVLETGESAELADHALLLTRDGREIPVADSAAPILTANKKVSGVVMVFRDQTAGRENRRKLEENEARFRKLLETIELIPVQGYNEAREVIYWNAASQRVYGYTEEEAMGRRLEELIIPPEMRADVIRMMDVWHAGGDPIPSAECVLQNKAGEPVDVFSSHVMHTTLTGRQEMFCIDVDLRDLKSAENQMRESRNLLRAIIDTIPGRVWWKDLDCRFLGTNIHCSRDFGAEDPEALVGKTGRDIFKNEWDADCDAADRQVLETGEPILGIQELAGMPNGTLRWFETNKAPLRDSDGNIIGTVGTSTDITERKSVEIELQRLSTAIEQSPEAIVITDADGTIQYVNPAFETVSGYSREEALRKNPRILKSGQHDRIFYQQLWETISAGKVWEGRFVNRRKDSTLYTEEVSIAPVKDECGTIVNYVAIKRDISQELLREEELRQSQKMEAIGLLAGGIAHDFNNLLQAIIGFSELMLYDLEAGSQSYKNALEVKMSSCKAVALTKQLLAFSRKNPLDNCLMNINSAVHETEPLINILLGEQYRLKLILADGLPPVRTDSGQLSQVIMNLAVNARDAMPAGGDLVFATEQVFIKEGDAAGPDSRAGRFICLSITDTGCGIEDHIKQRLFEPFFTTKELGRGTGLGLSVVYGIMKQNNGWVDVESSKGHGSVFRLYFPVADTQQNTEGLSGEADRRFKILVVDDDPQVLALMSEILQDNDFDIDAAASKAEALKRFKDRDGFFDLLLADMMLPDGNGLEVADSLRSDNPRLAVLLCSGHSEQQQKWEQLEDRDYSFMSKPFSAIGLIQSIMDVLSKQQ